MSDAAIPAAAPVAKKGINGKKVLLNQKGIDNVP